MEVFLMRRFTSIPQVRVDVGTMNCCMTSGTPACALSKTGGVGKITYSDGIGHCDLGMAFQAQVVIIFYQHLIIDGSMRPMTNGTALPEGLMLKDTGSSLVLMALHADVVLSADSHAFRSIDIFSVWIVTVDAVHPSFSHRMMILEIKGHFDPEMTLITNRRILSRIDNILTFASAHFQMKAAFSVAGLAPQCFSVVQGDMESSMSRILEILHNIFVA